MFGCQRRHAHLAAGRHHDHDDVTALGQVAFLQAAEIAGQWPGHQAVELEEKPVGLGQRLGEAGGGAEILERSHHLDPGIGGRQRQFDLDHDAGRAVGVQGLADVGAAQLDQARRLLASDDLQRQHRTGVAQLAVAHRADARRAAADIAADRGLPPRRGEHAQLPAALLGERVGRLQPHAGLEAAAAALDPQGAVEARHVEQHPALQWHHLAVVAGGAAAHAERHAQPRAGGSHLHDLLDVRGTTIRSAALPSSWRLRIGEYQ